MYGYALVLIVAVAPLYLWVLPAGQPAHKAQGATATSDLPVDRRLYWLLTAIFAIGAIIMTAVSVQLVAVLQGQGIRWRLPLA